MNNEKEKTFQDIVEEIQQASMEGPTFSDKSRFQLEKFVIGVHGHEARQYRAVLLEINQKTIALKKAQIRRKRIKSEIDRLSEEFDKEKDQYKKVAIECDIEDKALDLETEEKLILDAATEFKDMYSIFKQLPKFTAEQFETCEIEYWKHRLIKDAQLQVLERGAIESGTAKSLHQIGYNPIQVQAEMRLINQSENDASLLRIVAANNTEKLTDSSNDEEK